MKSQTPEMIDKNRPATGEFVASLSANSEQRRRLSGLQDPSLLFGTAVFAQMVAADLVRESQLAAEDLLLSEEGADADELQVSSVEEAQGLFGSISSSAAGLTPLIGGAAMVGSLPGSSSNAASVLSSGSGGNTAGEVAQEPDAAQNSFFARNFNALQNGGSPDANGAGQVSPSQEADGAQAAAASAQEQYASAGGASPFATPPTPEAPVMMSGQSQMQNSTASPDGVETQQAAPLGAQPAAADAAPEFNSAQEMSLNAGQMASPVSSAALPDAQSFGAVPEMLAFA